jgi:ubiquitin-like modifier-activating enzyme ATG7
MLRRAFGGKDFLENVAGLDQLKRESEATLERMEWEEGGDEVGDSWTLR